MQRRPSAAPNISKSLPALGIEPRLEGLKLTSVTRTSYHEVQVRRVRSRRGHWAGSGGVSTREVRIGHSPCGRASVQNNIHQYQYLSSLLPCETRTEQGLTAHCAHLLPVLLGAYVPDQLQSLVDVPQTVDQVGALLLKGQSPLQGRCTQAAEMRRRVAPLGSGRVKKVQRVKKGHRYLWYLNPGPQCKNGFWYRFFP